MISSSFFICFLCFLAASVQGFSTCSTASVRPDTCLSAETDESISSTAGSGMSRSAFFWSAACAATSVVEPAWAAKETDPALKGTKKDPNYEACISKCIYDCTKPKVDGQKSRSECIPECKAQCATSKEQLMIGTPLKK